MKAEQQIKVVESHHNGALGCTGQVDGDSPSEVVRQHGGFGKATRKHLTVLVQQVHEERRDHFIILALRRNTKKRKGKLKQTAAVGDKEQNQPPQPPAKVQAAINEPGEHGIVYPTAADYLAMLASESRDQSCGNRRSSVRTGSDKGS